MEIQFFVPMLPPTVTHQEHKIRVVNGKPYVYEPPELKAARAKLEAHLAQHRPETPMHGALMLVVKWCFPLAGRHRNGEYKATRPDTDNLQKLLKDVMTKLGFWKDDAQVASEVVEKFYSEKPGLLIGVERLAE